MNTQLYTTHGQLSRMKIYPVQFTEEHSIAEIYIQDKDDDNCDVELVETFNSDESEMLIKRLIQIHGMTKEQIVAVWEGAQ